MRVHIASAMLVFSFVATGQEEPVAAPTLLNPRQYEVPYDSGVLQRQFDTLTSMRLTNLEYSVLGPIRNIKGDLGIVLPESARRLKKGDPVQDVLPLLKDVLLATGGESFSVSKHRSTESPAMLGLDQSIDGIPVFTGGVSMSYDPTTLRVSSITATFLPDRGLSRTPRLSANAAEQRVPKYLAAAGQKDVHIEIHNGTYLAYYADWWGGSAPVLVWVVSAAVGAFHQKFLVDTSNGEVVYKQNVTRTLTNGTSMSVLARDSLTDRYAS
jgi:hypothetical protein